MEDKTFELIEKVYIELTSFKKEVNQRFDNMEQRMTKLEVNQEQLNDKVSEAFESITNLAETNDRQHQEIMKELKGEISIVETAIKKVAK